MSNGKYLILSCDGGGIRGVVTTMLLQNLGDEFLAKVSLFAGTSTGSIIALGLASGVPIDTLVTVYQDPTACGQIFSGNGCASDPFQGRKEEIAGALLKAAADVESARTGSSTDYWKLLLGIIDEMFCPTYSNDGRKTLLEKYLPNLTLAQLQKKALVTTFQLNAKNPSGQSQWTATTLHNLPNSSTAQTLVVDAAMCSSSPPLYFPPYQLPSGTLCIDGGMFANNPSTVALSSLIGSGLITTSDLSNVYLLSVGTGANRSSFPYTAKGFPTDVLALFPYGILGWLWPEVEEPVPPFPLLEAMFDGGSQINDIQTSMLLPPGNYIRAQLDLGEHQISLADCSRIPKLIHLTKHYMKSDEWQKVIEWAKPFSTAATK